MCVCVGGGGGGGVSKEGCHDAASFSVARAAATLHTRFLPCGFTALLLSDPCPTHAPSTCAAIVLACFLPQPGLVVCPKGVAQRKCLGALPRRHVLDVLAAHLATGGGGVVDPQ